MNPGLKVSDHCPFMPFSPSWEQLPLQGIPIQLLLEAMCSYHQLQLSPQNIAHRPVCYMHNHFDTFFLTQKLCVCVGGWDQAMLRGDSWFCAQVSFLEGLGQLSLCSAGKWALLTAWRKMHLMLYSFSRPKKISPPGSIFWWGHWERRTWCSRLCDH